MLTLGGRTDRDCDSHFTAPHSKKSTAQKDSVTWPRSHGKSWINTTSQASWWDCNVSGTSVSPVLHPALLPASAHRHCLPCPQMNCPQSYLQRSAPPLGCWISAPLNDFVLVITLSSLYQVHSRCLITPISIQTFYNISHLKKQTNPPLILHPFRTCLLSLLSLTQKASKTVYTAHVSP